jgi:hypothetical protein
LLFSGREGVLDYLGGPSVISGVLKTEKGGRTVNIRVIPDRKSITGHVWI